MNLLTAAKVLEGEPALVGVSGGVDSMVLLHLLSKHPKIQVAHFNHQLRGKASDADERLVRQTAKKLGIPCHVECADVKAVAREQKLSIEMAARKCRHEFFARLAHQLGIRRIVLAHHADDQVELFFLRLLRGAGPEGLAGMASSSPSPVDPALTIIRPLLCLTKDEIRSYAVEHKIPFREDATNTSESILRNRIRHKLIPLLKSDYQPGLTQAILRVIGLLKAESDFIAGEAERSREPFDQLPVALQRRRVRDELYAADIDPNFDLIEHLRVHPKIAIMVSPGQTVMREPSGTLRVSEPTFWATHNVSVNVANPGSVEVAGVIIHWSNRKGKPAKQTEYFDADRIGDRVILRHWRPGDRFQPIGMKNSVKLQDLFTNLKVPRDQRHQRVIATTADGEIFWVEGLRIAEAFKIRPSTARILRWRWAR